MVYGCHGRQTITNCIRLTVAASELCYRNCYLDQWVHLSILSCAIGHTDTLGDVKPGNTKWCPSYVIIYQYLVVISKRVTDNILHVRLIWRISAKYSQSMQFKTGSIQNRTSQNQWHYPQCSGSSTCHWNVNLPKSSHSKSICDRMGWECSWSAQAVAVSMLEAMENTHLPYFWSSLHANVQDYGTIWYLSPAILVPLTLLMT